MAALSTSAPAHPGLGRRAIASRWGWFVALGIALIAIGVLAAFEVVAVTLVSTIFIGAALLVGGVIQIVHAFATRDWSHFLLNLLIGALWVAGGVLIMAEPIGGSIVLTILVAASLVVGGIMRIVIALQHREMPGWWLLVLGGIVSLAVGVVLYLTLPLSALWVLGTLIAVELIFNGAGWLQFGLDLRRAHQAIAAMPG
jgi:uncharacterized membrane protein HdeD (DUF308 family)